MRNNVDKLLLMLDMDGVLLESPETPSDTYRNAAENALRDLNTDTHVSRSSPLASFHLTYDLIRVCDQIGIPVYRFWELREKYAARIVMYKLKNGKQSLFDDVASIRELTQIDTCCIVSNNRVRTVMDVVEHFGLDFVDFCIGRTFGVSCYFKRKPRPTLLDMAIRKAEPCHSIYVGDRVDDVKAAVSAGSTSVFLRRPHNVHQNLSVDPDFVIDSLYSLVDCVRGF